MQLELEDLEYQRRAIAAVVGVLEGQIKNTFDNSNLFGIQANITDLTPEQLEENKKRIIAENGIAEEDAKLSSDADICIEMETGTGKTLVYLRTAYELYKEYRLTKFIILVPSIAIKEGVLQSVEDFKKPLADRYGFTPACFEYDSSKLSRLKHFIEDTQPQIMVMTIQSIASDDRIINQPGRDDAFLGLTFLQALGKCRPLIIMDEPQEGMDTDNAVARLATLNPLVKLRYSATHKVVKNLLYRLTPFDAYRNGMVKKIEVLSVAEKNDEATLKIEFSRIQANGTGVKAKVTVWRVNGDGFKWKETNWLKVGDNLADKSANVSYRDYTIERIWKSIHDQKHHLKFTNGVEIILKERNGDISGLFRQQLQWLIRRHFQKKRILAAQGIKCLSLIFIDKVDNYVRDEGLIRVLFREEYASVHREILGTDPTLEQIAECQGYYFAKTGGDEYTDSENAMLRNKKIFDEILRDKRSLLDLANPREFIFSHSALGVGWDNPNIFNIATLNESYSDVKKRQELGRGLRICRNQNGQRIYDVDGVKEGEETNLLTIVPNETYETFAAQYQEQIKEIYGTTAAGSMLRKNQKGRPAKNRLTRTKHFESAAFNAFWERLARKTDYTVAFDEEKVVERAIGALNKVAIADYEAEIVQTRIRAIAADSIASEEVGRVFENLRASFTPFDLVEELSENTALSYPTVLEIVSGIENFSAVTRNPPKFLATACALIREIELDEMLRSLSYHPTGESIPLTEFQEIIETFLPVEPTPQRGVYDGVAYGSSIERSFTKSAELDNEVVCFLKLPKCYRIPTPIGHFYEPDFGLVLKRRNLRSGDEHEYYFVIETKSTSNLEDRKALTDAERWKIKCAIKHFDAIEIEAKLDYRPYIAPVKNYQTDFKVKVPQP
ncbi:MAG TPA: DEAD/DEAH box helicase family protein [Chthoniobacterales bacterium]|nr:DEAD/DEAH box helicase family protein [Chthoniobacterales bacterium]